MLPLTDAWPKRLSDRIQGDARGVFEPWMDESAARERFRSSAYIARIWPPALRERTLAEFEVQRVVNAIGRGEGGLGWPRRLSELHALLAEPAHPEVAQWRLGITSDHVAAAERARRSGRSRTPHERALAIRALVDGEPDRAARGFARARRRQPAQRGLLLLELYARCRTGDLAAARELLARERDALDAPGARESVRWLTRTFGLREEAS